MNKLNVPSVAILTIAFLPFGCGPMQPMPVRLQDEGQARINQSWDRVFEPVDRFSRQSLLDGLVAWQGYQAGVDTLEFRSEKQCTAGLVIMEIHYDRLIPDRDQFTVRLVNGGRVLREEHYTRNDIEQTNQYLYEMTSLAGKSDKGERLTPQESYRLAQLRARNEPVQAVFPGPYQ